MAFTELHQKCNDCGSSDALSYNEDGSSYCFACATFTPSPDGTGGSVRDINDYRVPEHRAPVMELRGAHRSLQDRGLDARTMEKYSTTLCGEDVHFGYHTPDGELTAVKKRTPDKKFKIEGDWKKAGLFGQYLFLSLIHI